MLLVALARLFEPFVMQLLLQLYCPCLKAGSKIKYNSESLCSFLNSAINIEYVYLILSGINKHLESKMINDSFEAINLSEVTFKNLEEWNVTKMN